MTKKPMTLAEAVKLKRESADLSIRKLSEQVGVSFSTLSRIERGQGEPDLTTKMRLLEWLGPDAPDSGGTSEKAAFVHFRAAKNLPSNAVENLFKAALTLKKYGAFDPVDFDLGGEDGEDHVAAALTKAEMDKMADGLRKKLKVPLSKPLEATKIQAEGINVCRVSETDILPKQVKKSLIERHCDAWSAMSVPLDRRQTLWTILVNDCHTIERQRVTFLEEFWHIILGHRLTRVERLGDGYGRSYEAQEEHDAFYLASATLLPKSEVLKRVDSGKSMQEIAEHFGVSTQLVSYRVKRLGLWSQVNTREITIAR